MPSPPPSLARDEVSGLAKAWVNFNGTGAVAIRASYNVSSITDNGTGDYTVNFTTAMADANYWVGGMTDRGIGGPGGTGSLTVELTTILFTITSPLVRQEYLRVQILTTRILTL
jgi:hypothetical protein